MSYRTAAERESEPKPPTVPFAARWAALSQLVRGLAIFWALYLVANVAVVGAALIDGVAITALGLAIPFALCVLVCGLVAAISVGLD